MDLSRFFKTKSKRAVKPPRFQVPQGPVMRQVMVGKLMPGSELKADFEPLWRASEARGVRSLVVQGPEYCIHVIEGPSLGVGEVANLFLPSSRDHRGVHLVSVFEEQEPLLLHTLTVVPKVTGIDAEMMEEFQMICEKYHWASGNLEVSPADIGFLKHLAVFAFQRPAGD